MTYPLEPGETFEVHTKDGKLAGRVIHKGNGVCDTEVWSNGGWHLSRANVPLNQDQLGEWLKRKTGQATVFSAMCHLPN